MKRTLLLALVLFSLIGFEMPRSYSVPDGAYGVFQAGDIVLPLYQGEDQAVIDAEDSALIRQWGRGYLIADHAGSLHNGVRWYANDLKVGSTAFLTTESEIRAYKCVAILKGENTGYSYTFEGREVWAKENDIVCASCGRKNEVYLGYFDYTGTIERRN